MEMGFRSRREGMTEIETKTEIARIDRLKMENTYNQLILALSPRERLGEISQFPVSRQVSHIVIFGCIMTGVALIYRKFLNNLNGRETAKHKQEAT